MSRGIGRTQRLALLALWQARAAREAEERDIGIPRTELKRGISADRSNARRAIRNLTERGLIEEITGEEGSQRIVLTEGGSLALWLAAYPHDTPAFERVPSRPLDLGIFDYDADEEPTYPLGSSGPSWFNDAIFKSAVSDPPKTTRNPIRQGNPYRAEPPISNCR